MASWSAEAKATATARLGTLPKLTGNEEAWRFTAPEELALDGSEPPGSAPAVAVAVPSAPAGRLAHLSLVDGRMASFDGGPSGGVIVADLADAIDTHEALVREHLYRLVGFDDLPGALNAARWASGLFVHVPRGVDVTLPIEALNYATGAEGRVFGRTLVVVEAGAKVTVIDRYLSPDVAAPVHASTVTEIVAGEGAEVEHVSYVNWGAGVRHHHILRAEANKDARVRSVVVSLGGDVLRIEPTMVLAGPGSDARALGLFFAANDQHFEHRVIARHEAPAAYSNLLYKGAIQDRAHTVFFGNLVVPPGAPGTDAYQTNRNLVLNEGARADTIPFLEIETAEVKCSHAGAVSRVDDEHLFYLSSRGVPVDEGKRLIVYGFFQEVLDQVRLPELRGELEAAVAAKVQ
ncbi:MAG: Fe-S cluster assembly protein SufD [Actinobacteria bacterium]|nr:Fe-S cluster assembly protein SufD [Actinomycetota bacterium]